MASEQNRFLQQQQQQPASTRRKRWGGCLNGLSCFGLQKGGKRVVPASRMPETQATANQQNGPQATGLPNQNNPIHPSLLAPPSSPASFSNSALQSTAQSPNCFLSANSPGGPSSTMFATGPYAHETQLVSPPVFSTFTTEPSTAPLTPPPELAHLTTPSSPDVPYAQFLSSTLKGGVKTNYTNDLQATYSLYPGSPASTLRSPISRTSGDGLSPRWNPSPQEKRSDSGRLSGMETDGGSSSKLPQDANFFCPETFAQFYLDQSAFPHSGGRLSVSKESDVNGGNGVQSRQSKACKQDIEELEAYRASFGFSADEIVTTAHYVEISDVMDDSFSMNPSGKNVQSLGESEAKMSDTEKRKKHEVLSSKNCRAEGVYSCKEGQSPCDSLKKDGVKQCLTDDEDVFSRMGGSRMNGKYHMQSNSDAEVEYRRGRSFRESSRGNLKWP